MYRVRRTTEEIDNQLADAAAWEEVGMSASPGMSYEAGVAAGMRWLVGETEDVPIEDVPDPVDGDDVLLPEEMDG